MNDRKNAETLTFYSSNVRCEVEKQEKQFSPILVCELSQMDRKSTMQAPLISVLKTLRSTVVEWIELN